MQEMGSTNSSGRGGARASSGAWASWLVSSAFHVASTRPGNPGDLPQTSEVRASDKERAEVMDLLGSHFAEGRLDERELDERLQAAGSAKTRGELAGLLSDLPIAEEPAPAPPEHVFGSGRGLTSRGIVLLLVVLFAAALIGAGHVTGALFVGFLIVALLRSGRRRRERARYHEHLHAHGTPHWHAGRRAVVADVSRLDRH